MDEKPEERGERDEDREKERPEKTAEKELAAIKEQSLGSKKPKKRVIRPSEKFRFSFDWENTEDNTSSDMNALYQAPREARLLYGPGFLVGIDHHEEAAVAVSSSIPTEK